MANVSADAGPSTGVSVHDSFAFQGRNGGCASLLCDATAGWDGPMGLATPAGTGAF